jgi:hypothetical protein
MRHLLAALGLVAVCAPVPAPAIDIFRCGQVISRGEPAVLQVDLDCGTLPGSCLADDSIPCSGTTDPVCPAVLPGSPGPGEDRWCMHGMIVLPPGAGLYLNGHALVGDPVGLPYAPVFCNRGRCIVQGPGEIRGSSRCGIELYRAKLAVSYVNIHDNACGISSSVKGRITASNLTVSHNAGVGLEATAVTGQNIVASDNGADGVTARNVRITGLVATNNGGNPSAFPTGGAGVSARSVRLEDATVTGNNGYDQGLDIVSEKAPQVRDVTCGRSARLVPQPSGAPLPGPPWGICASD